MMPMMMESQLCSITRRRREKSVVKREYIDNAFVKVIL